MLLSGTKADERALLLSAYGWLDQGSNFSPAQSLSADNAVEWLMK
jgi:hypothetical protein